MKQESADLGDRFSEAEWNLRVDLACAYRLVAHLGWDMLLSNHITTRLPGPERHFLINPHGLMYHEVKASNLVKVDLAGEILGPSNWGINEAGFVVHSAVHTARDDLHCVIHTHTDAGVAVACQADGLLPLSLSSLILHGRIAYHDCEGVTTDRAESARIASDLGDKDLMILRNHGLLAGGPDIASAFFNMYQLERACRAQIMAQSGGARLNLLDGEIPDRAAAQFRNMRTGPAATAGSEMLWNAMRRWMNEIDPSYAK
jgi:ribulose-5-phosphate 4-epimerase/fuculose-1-phosphate aldolase